MSESEEKETHTYLGYYHKFNCLKFRIAYALFLTPRPQDTTEIAEFLNEPMPKISNALSRYKKTGCPYFRRIKKWKGATNHDVRWVITASGINFLANCFYNINTGRDLNFKRNRPQKKIKDRKSLHSEKKIFFTREQYSNLFGINRLGSEKLGLKVEDLLDKYNQVSVNVGEDNESLYI